MSNYRQLLELAHATTEIALQDNNALSYPDWENLDQDTYERNREHDSIIHEALVVILRCVEAMMTLRYEGCNSKPDLDYADILRDPRGTFSHPACIGHYLGIWRYSGEQPHWWGSRDVIPIEDLAESDGL